MSQNPKLFDEKFRKLNDLTQKVWQAVSNPDSQMQKDMKSWLANQKHEKNLNAQDEIHFYRHSSICTNQVVDFLRQRPPIPTTKYQFEVQGAESMIVKRGVKSTKFSLGKITNQQGT